MNEIKNLVLNLQLRILAVCAIVIVGVSCGGGPSAGTEQALPQTAGKAVFTIKWPAKTRVVPTASASIVIQLDYKYLGPLTSSASPVVSPPIVSPGNGGTTTWVSPPLAAGTWTVTATAYPQADGGGVAQAVGGGTVAITPLQSTPVPITMDSTVATLTITPSYPTVAVGGSIQLTATATDANNNMVLVAPSTISWTSGLNTSNTNPGLTSTITGVDMGTSVVTAIFTEVNSPTQAVVSANTTVTVYVNLTGTWSGTRTWETPEECARVEPMAVTLTETGNTLSGDITNFPPGHDIINGTVTGANMSFASVYSTYTATVSPDGNTITGNFQGPYCGVTGQQQYLITGPFTWTRVNPTSHGR